MKKYILPAMLFCAASMFAQTTTYTLNIHFKNGDKVQYSVSDIDRMTFDGEAEDPEPGEAPVKLQIPTDFSSGWVQKVMVGDKQVAEVDKEYIRSIDKQVVVIYPMGENGRADLTKGLTSTGASVVWDLAANTATVGTEGAEALTEVYVVNGAIVTSYDGEASDATLAADVIVDKRGLFERNTYKIVKIGTQYWMAENLRTVYFRDGSMITGISETDKTVWSENTTGAYLTNSESDWVKTAGYLYNGYCVTSDKGIAPEGWEVPTKEQFTKLRTAGKLVADNFKSTEFLTWTTGKTGNNITGFDAVATGYYSTATGLASELTETYFWSSTTFKDPLTRPATEGLELFRINATANNVFVTSNAGHALAFGHAIRCVRKD